MNGQPAPKPLVEAEIAFECDRTAAIEQRIRSTILAQPGVQSAALYGELAVVRFDPLVTSNLALRHALLAANVRVLWITSAPVLPGFGEDLASASAC